MTHKQAIKRYRLGFALFLLVSTLFVPYLSHEAVQAQGKPTPIVITLTAPATATATATETPTPATFPDDSFEPNDVPEAAVSLGLGSYSGLTHVGEDRDYFQLYLKSGQILELSTTAYDGLDTRLMLFKDNQPAATNDDRSPTELGSLLVYTAHSDGWYIILVEKVAFVDGRYDLLAQLLAPTATATASPTSTPTNTPSPTPLPTSIVMPTLGPTPVTTGATIRPSATPGVAMDSPTLTITGTPAGASGPTPTPADGLIPLTARYLGPATDSLELPMTHVRLLVYYDANNDRSPGPGEGIPNVSVLAVDAQGQPLAQIFTNVTGEAIFNLSSEQVARVIVPFVPGWSARLRPGEQHDDIQLGLPAVRLPVFLPVAMSEEEG